MEKDWDHYEIKNTALSSSDSTSGYLSEETQNTNLKEYLHSYIYWNIIYNSQDTKATQIPSINNWVKSCGIYT